MILHEEEGSGSNKTELGQKDLDKIVDDFLRKNPLTPEECFMEDDSTRQLRSCRFTCQETSILDKIYKGKWTGAALRAKQEAYVVLFEKGSQTLLGTGISLRTTIKYLRELEEKNEGAGIVALQNMQRDKAISEGMYYKLQFLIMHQECEYEFLK